MKVLTLKKECYIEVRNQSVLWKRELPMEAKAIVLGLGDVILDEPNPESFFENSKDIIRAAGIAERIVYSAINIACCFM